MENGLGFFFSFRQIKTSRVEIETETHTRRVGGKQTWFFFSFRRNKTSRVETETETYTRRVRGNGTCFFFSFRQNKTSRVETETYTRLCVETALGFFSVSEK